MGLPVVLHLMMRRKPRHQWFPAMRFLQLRQVANQRQLRLRHWLLLALRIAVIGFLAALFARPSVDSANSGYWLKSLLLGVLSPFAIVAAIYCWSEAKSRSLLLAFAAISLVLLGGFFRYAYLSMTTQGSRTIGDEDAPVAAVLVFDTSPRMGLLHENKSRLEEAQQTAKKLIAQLPTDSAVAILDAAGSGVFSLDMASAVNLVESLQVLGFEHSLADLTSQGIDLVVDREDRRQEVYVLTDLSRRVWEDTKFSDVDQQLARHPNVSLFVLDVGVEAPRNAQLGPLQLNAETLAAGQPLTLQTSLLGTNMAGQEVLVEVSIEEQDLSRPVIVDDDVLLPPSVTRRRQPTTLAETEVPLQFDPIGGLGPGLHHGRVQLIADDGLPADDARYFTIEVQPPQAVLLVAGEGSEPKYVEMAISPTELRDSKQNTFDCEVIPARDLLSRDLLGYAVVGLLDPPAMPPAAWQQLSAYVEQGGGLAIFLGRNALPSEGVALLNQRANSVLPGDLARFTLAPRGEFFVLSLPNTAHPVLTHFRGQSQSVGWDQSPIFRHWSFEELDPGTNVLARFSNNQPALIEHVLGKGRVLTLTTPVSDRGNDRRRPPWNQLPTSEHPLPFFMLMVGMFPYLANPAGAQWNHEVGDVVELAVSESTQDTTWQLFTPQLDWQNVRSQEGRLVLTNTHAAGHYRLKRGQDAKGFSANLATDATDVQRLDSERLDVILGKGQYTLARGPEELSREIGRARVGRELFPFLMLCVVGILAMEHLVSNRFYAP